MNERIVFPASTRGLSLVELMVAITVGLMVLAAVSTIFVNSRASYVTQESMARLQESARFAMHFLSKDLRMAGYYGCVHDLQNINSTLSGGGGAPFDFTVAIEGIEGNTTSLYPSGYTVAFPTSGTAVASQYEGCPNYVGGKCDATDAVAVRLAAQSDSVDIVNDMPNTAAAMFVNENNGLSVGDVIMVSDCSSADILQITNMQQGPAGSGTQAVVHNSGSTGPTPGNETQQLSRPYGPGAQITKFVQRIYYIGTGQSGYPALYRMNIDGTGREELVEGVANMQVIFGVATAGDRTPRTYLPADAPDLGLSKPNWSRVVSTRIALTSISTTPQAQDLQVEEKEFSSTVLLRNLK